MLRFYRTDSDTTRRVQLGSAQAMMVGAWVSHRNDLPNEWAMGQSADVRFPRIIPHNGAALAAPRDGPHAASPASPTATPPVHCRHRTRAARGTGCREEISLGERIQRRATAATTTLNW
eukprot:6538540-Prymnesium_polylepis.2